MCKGLDVSQNFGIFAFVMKYKVYSTRRESNIIPRGIVDTADDFYCQLETACDLTLSMEQRSKMLRGVFSRVVEQDIADCQIAFSGRFSKLDYALRQHDVPRGISNLIHLARKEMFPEFGRRDNKNAKNEEGGFFHNVKATALLVQYLCGADVPDALRQKFPPEDRKSEWGAFDENLLRVIVDRWDDEFIWVREEENGKELKVCYSDANENLTRNGAGSWGYLGSVLWKDAQLNLVRVRMNEDVCFPELIILEPDYLVNVTTIASCFETYAESPFVNLVNKIKPSANSMPIHLGNLAGRFLDDVVHQRNVSFEDSLREFVSDNAISMISCQELTTAEGFARFRSEARKQLLNIRKLIGEDLPLVVGEYDNRDVVLEPTFFSEVLGIQGRLDFLCENNKHITVIEQKSGKGAFVPGGDPQIPVPQEKHTVQLLLYRALLIYEFRKYASDIEHIMLLYSKYERGLVRMTPMPGLFLRAMKMRNLLAWTEFLYAKEGMDMLETMTPESLNKKGLTGRLWTDYVRPQLMEVLAPIGSATPLERMYYLRFMRFLENEQLLSKVGNKVKENSGFASMWHDTLEDKKSAGNIYDSLTVEEMCTDGDAVTSVVLRFPENLSADTSNFRVGDIVVFYPYAVGMIPNACAQMVNRATVVDITAERISLRLRNAQTDRRNFVKSDDFRWAVEHDMFESSSGALYSAMHSFLSATKRRRDLVLCQREPEVDVSLELKGDYGEFNELTMRAKQSRDMFLVIGPPGTGKTSYGLVNILKEELLEKDSNVLLLSYTNRAVDEICSKLMLENEKDDSFDFIRIGAELSCAEEYRGNLLSVRSKSCASGSDVARMIRNTRIFCGTTAALNANMPLFSIKHFDLAVIDESSQILEPHLIGLLGAQKNGVDAIERFVLIGDHKQLPAVVQQTQDESVVTEKELNEVYLTDCRDSLFERMLRWLRDKNGEYDARYVYMLTKQGRMHKEIAEFPNEAFYGGKLDVVPLEHQEQQLDKSAVDNGIERMLRSNRMAFVASPMPVFSPYEKTNAVEAEMIAATIWHIYNINKEGFDVNGTIGVIVPYRNQIATVRNAIDKYGVGELHNITIDTVERFQGSQRDYILYGFTVQHRYQLNFLASNVFEEYGKMIDRKLNVAMTRARKHLVLFGNPTVLKHNTLFAELMEYIKERGKYIDVPSAQYCEGVF